MPPTLIKQAFLVSLSFLFIFRMSSSVPVSSDKNVIINNNSHSINENNKEKASAIEEQRSKAAFVFKEAIYPGVDIEMELHQIMMTTHSPFQKVSVIETSFGKTLITDGKTQSSQIDEFIYHESLVHPAFVRAGLVDTNQSENENEKNDVGSKRKLRVFIGGGGELATAREVLKHKSVKEVVMVDLDKTVVDVCRKYLPEWGGDDVVDHPKFELIIGDAYQYLIDCKEKFDIIIMDISDPIEAGPGIMLYTKEFYEHVNTLLNVNGVFVTQAGAADSVCVPDVKPGSKEDQTCFAPIKNTLSEVFNCVLPYSVHIPSFGTDWGFIMAFASSRPEDSREEFMALNSNIVEDLLTSDVLVVDENKKCDILKYYDGQSHRRMFSLPKPVRRKFLLDKRIMTKENPVFMF